MANAFYNRGASFNPDELADGDAIEAEFDSVGRGFDTIEDLVNANKAGYPTQTFHVATATTGTHAVPKAQMDAALGFKLDAASYTATDVLNKLKTVDGSGSGVDADLLDGQDGACYRNASNINAGTLAKERLPASIDASTTGNAATATRLATTRQINGVNFDGTANITVADDTKLPLTGGDLSGPITFTPGSGNVLNFGATPVIRRFTGANSMSMGVGGDDTLLLGAGESVGIMATNLTLEGEDVHIGAETNIFMHVSSDNWATWAGKKTFSIDATNGPLWNGGKVWNAGNDGAGSGLDADLLDGQEGAYYRDAANLNAGILPDARLSGTYTGVSITGNAATASKLATARTITLTGDVTGSVAFDGSANATITAALSDAGVLTSCAAAAAGGVGTYMLAKVITSSALYYGGTYAASVLDTVVYDLTSSQWYPSSAVVLAGTWKCLGYNGTTSTNRATAALFLRIS